MNLLVTGSSGQLGNEFRRNLESMNSEIGMVSACYEAANVDYVDYESLDISDRQSVMEWFQRNNQYNLVINCAAKTNVDGCERDEATAFRVNALGPLYLAEACAACGSKLVHVSTDYVFPGTELVPRVEADAACPVSAYGRTKWAGELLALDANPRTYIVRTAWLYGYIGKNFVKTMMRLARDHGRISVVADQMGNPTSANDLAYEILRIAETENYGIYHCTNNGTCSWFEFASAVVDLAEIPCEKEALTSAEYKLRFPQSADRPAYSSLDNARLRETIGDDMRPWQEALKSYMNNLEALGD